MSQNAFDPVPSPLNFSAAEKEIIRFWKEHGTYRKSLERRKGAKPFVFYEGPPTANGKPHPGHCLTRTIKDIFPRYRTMDGYYCERKAGWDTHGLPVEIEVCKELGIIDGGKAAIEEFGVAEFNRTCIESVFRYKREWEEMTDRIGFWVDLEDAYVTFHQSYVESVWWALRQLFERGLLYQGHKVVWWWAQGGTALSAGEVGEGYRETEDPAITVGMSLTPESASRLGVEGSARLLVWTTTPWTLSSNCACAVGNDIDYAVVQEGEGQYAVLAAGLVAKYFGEEAAIVRTVKGADLVGLHYEPLFRYDTPTHIESAESSTRHWLVAPGDFVTLDTGTGIVHIAPAFGEDDYRLCKENGIGFLCFVKPDGTFDARVTDVDPYDQSPIAGRFCKDADKAIIRLLKERGVLLKHEQYRHSYPFCPRADKDPLIQYARKSWFIRTSQFIHDFLANNSNIQWQPEHIREGRFGNFLENNVDWALSRERYWGTPLPIWICDATGRMECVSRYDELLEKPGISGTELWTEAKAANPGLAEDLKIHKPYIDAITYDSPFAPGARMRRVPEVIDVWFDAGSMPFAQWGYPHAPGSEQRFKENFPADFISEAIDQTRGWFYALLAISTVVHGESEKGWPHPFRNVVCLGHIQGEDGLKLSKRLKNYSEPSILFEKYSADALRWSFVAKNPPTSTTRLSERLVEECQRELLVRWYNVFSFFTIYANLDGFDPSADPTGAAAVLRETGAAGEVGSCPAAPYRPIAERSELDRWILHELDRTILEVRAALDAYELNPAARAITNFLDGLSNWYVRRSRARFWSHGWSTDKADAYWTLYACLLDLSRLAAPFVPFFSEYTWRHLSKPLAGRGAVESVHLSSYPTANEVTLDRALLAQMDATREAVTLGLNARRGANIKVRQPLAQCEIIVADPAMRDGLLRHFSLIAEELNIKEVNFCDCPEEYVTYEVKPNFKTLGPRFGKQVKTIGAALASADGARLYQQLQQGAINLEVEGIATELGPDDVEVRLTPREGFAAAQGKGMVVVISTEITEPLRREGLVREFIRQVQDVRKELELAYDARIHIHLHTTDTYLAGVIDQFANTIQNETLAESVHIAEPQSEAREFEIEGSTVQMSVTVAK
jgi:isoleucyl-tRNA synthetase